MVIIAMPGNNRTKMGKKLAMLMLKKQASEFEHLKNM